MVRVVLAVVVGIGLLATACTDAKTAAPDTTVPTAAPTSSTTTIPDVSAIPSTIDEAYLNAVLAALDEADGRATRVIYAAKKINPEAADILDSVYGEDEFQLQVQHWAEAILRNPELKGIRPDPGPRRTTVERIIASAPACVWLAVQRDRSAVNVDPGPRRTEYVALQPFPGAGNDPHNPTAWIITADGRRSDGTEPTNPCP